jgi:hypothetical protein
MPQPGSGPKVELVDESFGEIAVEKYLDLAHPPCLHDDLKRWIFIPMFDFQAQRRKGIPFPPLPPGVRHPFGDLNLPGPHARGSPIGDVDGYAWGGLLGDFISINLTSAEMSKNFAASMKEESPSWYIPEEGPGPLGWIALATASRSQLRELGIWTFIDLDSCHLRPRVRRPWPILALLSIPSLQPQLLNLPDDGALESRPDDRFFHYRSRNNMYDSTPAGRLEAFRKTLHGPQLRMKQDVNWAARALDYTQPEYAIEQAQQKYEREYHTTRLFVPVRYGRSKFTKQAKPGLFVIEGDRLRVRGQYSPIEGKLVYCFIQDMKGKLFATELNIDIRIGKTRRELIAGRQAPSEPFLNTLNYGKRPTIWLHTAFVQCDSRPQPESTMGDTIRMFIGDEPKANHKVSVFS